MGKRGGMNSGNQPYIPTPKEIREAAARIRSGWSERRFQVACGYATEEDYLDACGAGVKVISDVRAGDCRRGVLPS